MQEHRHPRPTVLIVDDESAMRKLVAKFLNREGYETLTAKDGPDALKLYALKQSEIDVTLLDAMMPGMDGLETMVAIREIDPDAKFILSSGFPIEAFAESNLSGAFLGKPYTLSDLKNVVTGALLKNTLAGSGLPM